MRLTAVLLAIIGGYLKLKNYSQEMTQLMKVLFLSLTYQDVSATS